MPMFYYLKYLYRSRQIGKDSGFGELQSKSYNYSNGNHKFSFQFIYLQIKLYSISMLQARETGEIQKKIDKNSKTQVVRPLGLKQLKLSKKNLTFKSQRQEEIQSNLKTLQNIIDQNIIAEKQLMQIRRWRILFVGTSLAEFAFLFSEITMQYITSNIIIEVFLVLSILIVLTQISLQVLFYKSQTNNLTDNNQQNQDTTAVEGIILQDTKLKLNRNQAKTKKLNYPSIPHQNIPNITIQQTVKRLANKANESSSKLQSKANEQILMSMQLAIFIKIIDVVLGIAVTTVFLVKIQGYQSKGIIIVLTLASYFLIVASTFILIKIYWINKIFSNKVTVTVEKRSEKNHKSIQNANPSQKLETVVSIEQLMQKSVSSIQKSVCQKYSDCQNIVINESMNNNKQPEIIKYISKSQNAQKNINLDDINKGDLKKSVLKNQKTPKNVKVTSTTTHELQNTGLRKKVEIDSNKIQYFQYSQNSRSQSIYSDVMHENENNSIQNLQIKKKKASLPKLKFLMEKIDKMEMENKIIKSKKQNRAKTLAQWKMNEQSKISDNANIFS